MATSALTLATRASPPSSVDELAEQHSLKTSLALHLFPGVFIFVLFVIVAPLAMRAGLPSMWGVLGGATVGLGFQAAHLLYQGKQRNGKWSLSGIVDYREPMPIWQYVLLVPLFTIAAFVIYGLTSPLGTVTLNQLTWLPEWFEVRSVAILAQYPKSALVFLLGMNLLINGIAAPIIEETYFRGYLMPRLSRFGRWTPVVETGLFTLYHFWQPYYWVTQFLSMLPVAAAVSWKRNLKLGIFSHAALNIVGALLTFLQILG